MLVRVTFQHGAFGPRDTAVVAPVLAMYAIQIPFFVTSRVFYRFLVAMRRTDLVLYCGILNLVLDVVLNLVLMRWFGVAGIALATSLWTVSTFFFLWYWTWKLLPETDDGSGGMIPRPAQYLLRFDDLCPTQARAAVIGAVDAIDAGQARVAFVDPATDQVVVDERAKRAILLAFRLMPMVRSEVGDFRYDDRVPLTSRLDGVRVLPGAIVRWGAYVAPGTVLMPSFVNIGAYVDSGTMVDTWATVGSGAQIGKNVHLSGGAGIGGVLEPPSAVPVVVEDEAMIGSRCMVVGGARVREGAFLGAGAILTKTTHVIDVETGDELPMGEAPPWSVCVGGTRPRTFPGGTFGMPCLLVLKRQPEGVRHDKSALNQILRDHGVDA